MEIQTRELKALLMFASSDSTRKTLYGVAVHSTGGVSATNGHVAMWFGDVTGASRVVPLDEAKWIACRKEERVTLQPGDVAGPHMGAIVNSTSKSASTIGFDADYLSTIGRAAAVLGPRRKARPMKLVIGDECSPTFATFENYSFCIMPCRL